MSHQTQDSTFFTKYLSNQCDAVAEVTPIVKIYHERIDYNGFHGQKRYDCSKRIPLILKIGTAKSFHLIIFVDVQFYLKFNPVYQRRIIYKLIRLEKGTFDVIIIVSK